MNDALLMSSTRHLNTTPHFGRLVVDGNEQQEEREGPQS